MITVATIWASRISNQRCPKSKDIKEIYPNNIEKK
tara:strand:+ start:577 stop:681 length:105 start_codon:yes stop_codon:yes gene_type:complete